MAPNTRRKSAAARKRTPVAVIDTTILEKIDEDGDLRLRLKDNQIDDSADDEDDYMAGASIKAEDSESEESAAERWESNGDVDFLVSTKHMQMASPVFKQMTREPTDLLLLPDDDVEAFRILLNILHGRVRQVPLKVSLRLIRHIALIVRKYEMVEVAELYVKIWIKELPQPSKTLFTEDILAWICVCWVFELPEDFNRITRQAVWYTNSRIVMPLGNDYAFPARILGESSKQ